MLPFQNEGGLFRNKCKTVSELCHRPAIFGRQRATSLRNRSTTDFTRTPQFEQEIRAMILHKHLVKRRTPKAAWVLRCAGAFVFALVTMLILLPDAHAQQTSDAAPAGNVDNGKKLFNTVGCYECHGRMGQGAAQTGAARIGPPLLSFEVFKNLVREPVNQMPPYSAKAIPDQDLADIYAYLKSIPMPPKGKDIPLLNK
jgi:mono/diheme cytochrome c family protein